MAPAQMIEPKDLPPEVGVLGDGVPASVTPILTTSSSPTSQVLKPLGLEVPAGAALEAEAAQKLGIGRNTITRKIQELGLE